MKKLDKEDRAFVRRLNELSARESSMLEGITLQGIEEAMKPMTNRQCLMQLLEKNRRFEGTDASPDCKRLARSNINTIQSHLDAEQARRDIQDLDGED